jgi:predicted phosphoribosyltransferase
MKNMPGMDNIQSMLSKMGMPSNAKLDLNAMESKLNQNMKTAKMKERMKKKLDEKKASANVMDTIAELQKNIAKSQAENPLTDEQLVAMFSDNAAHATSGNKKKKNKNKK